MSRFLPARVRGTASTGPGEPPSGLIDFYWHFVRQTKGWYGLMFVASLAVADWRLALPTLLWFAGYALFLRHFVPRMRDLARASSEVRSHVMGRVVDSYTNILTVKLFARMHRLVVLDASRIVEQGTHDELLRLDGHYARLWRHQSGGFLAPDLVPTETETAQPVEEPADETRADTKPEPNVDDGPAVTRV